MSIGPEARCNVAHFCQELYDVSLCIKKDNPAGLRANELILSGQIELAVRGALNIEKIRRFAHLFLPRSEVRLLSPD